MDSELEQQLNYKIEDLEDEVTTLKEAVDDLMEENERLRKEIRELTKKEGSESVENSGS